MPFHTNIYYQVHQQEGIISIPVVLIHGAGGSHLNWPKEIRQLPGTKMIALDLPGHGKSDGSGFQTIHEYAKGIFEWSQSIGIDQAFFIGHSMGGAIALELALSYPDIVKGIALVSSGAKLSVADFILTNTAGVQTAPDAIAVIIQWAFSQHAPKTLIANGLKQMSDCNPETLHRDFLACNAFNVRGRVETLRTPCLVLCGEEDKMTPVRYSQYLCDAIPGARLAIIPQAGHMVMLEKPVEVAQEIQTFLQEWIE